VIREDRLSAPSKGTAFVKTIIVGYDDTEPSKRARERAVELAKAFDAKLLVTSVAPIMEGAGRSMGPLDPTDMPEKHRAELQEAAATIEAAGLKADLVPVTGHPAEAIVYVAQENAADLIVVGTRELGFVQRMLGQSTSEAVAHRARCDVLIVH
jgi:nucleotide-binding universal stress UspA family protein